MKRLFSASIIAAALATAPGAQAAELLWAGVLEDAGGLVDRPVSAIFTVKDAADAVVLTQTEASLLVVDGTFVVALDVPDEDELSLEVVINGTALEPAAPLPTTWARAARAGEADVADRAEAAQAIGGVTNPLTTAGLGSAGFPLANVTGFPSGFDDGDDGIEFVAGDTISFASGIVSIAPGALSAGHVAGSLVSADLAPQTLTNADFADGGLSVGDVNVTAHTSIANGTLTGRHLAGNKVDVFQVTEVRCSETLNSLTTQNTCNYSNIGDCVVNLPPPAGPTPGKLGCPANPVCNLTSTSLCPNPRVGVLVFP